MSEEMLLERFADSLTEVRPQTDALGRSAILLADHLALTQPVTEQHGDLATVAARAAFAASSRDADDVHWTGLVHPGAPVWATSLALAHSAPAPGPVALRCATVGYEVAVRLALALQMAGVDARFHRTALVGPAAVAAAVAAAQGAVTADALGHALSLAGGSAGALRELSGTRAVHRSATVLTGFLSARAARDGVRSTRRDLEFGGGAFPPLTGAAAQALTHSADAVQTTSVRVFPTSGWNQTVYEAARSAAHATGEEQPIRIDAVVPPVAYDRSVPSSQDPWHNLEIAVARGAGLSPEATELIGVRRGLADSAIVTVWTAGGHAGAEVSEPLDSPHRPATTADLAGKWGLDADAAHRWLTDLAHWLSGDGPNAHSPSPPLPHTGRQSS